MKTNHDLTEIEFGMSVALKRVMNDLTTIEFSLLTLQDIATAHAYTEIAHYLGNAAGNIPDFRTDVIDALKLVHGVEVL